MGSTIHPRPAALADIRVSDGADRQLIRYNEACRALAAAIAVDECKKIRNEAEALRAYARQAKNRELEINATEIRIRAERRVGELIAGQRETVGLNKGAKGTIVTGFKRNPVKDDRPTLAEAGIDKNLADRARKLAAVPETQFETLVDAWRDRAGHVNERVTTDLIRGKDVPTRLAVHFSSESPEHYTPAAVLDAARAVMGAIDLDPCSNSRECPNVPASEHYTAAEDGLRQPWRGRVFLNPPYGREIAPWMVKVREEWARGEILELVALLPARTDTEWFNVLTADTDDLVVCFLFGRLTFVGNTDPAPFPSMVGYFGPNHDRFARVFHPLGSLWQRPGAPLEWFMDHS